MSVAPDPQESGPVAHTPDQSSGERKVTFGDVSGIVTFGDGNVIVQFAKGATTEHALAELVEQLVQAVRAERGSVDDELAQKADLLAHEVRARLQREVAELRLRDRDSLPVRWQPVPGNVLGRGEDIRKAPAGATDAPPLDLAGSLDEITAGGHEQADSPWLLVLGRGGSGKSALALRFALTRLKARRRAREAPVPVIFSLGSWNPQTTLLRNWLINRLERDQSFLAEAGPTGNKTWAATLVDADYVLPILDGFDEIAIGLRKDALIALNSCDFPLLVTSRRAEIEAVREEAKVVPSAAAIELIDLNLDDSVNYLQEATGTTLPESMDVAPRTGWAYVLRELRRRPHTQAAANLGAVLTTPLMVTLARFVYESELDPSDLLKPEKFGTREALEKHLLDIFIPTAYKRFLSDEPAAGEHRRWDAERAQHWLRYLAAHLTELKTPDIEWWRLGTTVKLRWLMLRVGVTVGIASGLVAGLVNGAEDGLLYGPAVGFMAASLTGPVNGLGLGLTFGLMHGFVTKMKVGGPKFEPSLMEIRLRGWTKNGTKARLRESFRPRVAGGLAGGLLFGLLWALGGAALMALLGVPGPMIALSAGEELAVGIGLGFAMGLVAALGAGFETVIPREEREEFALPSVLLNTNRATVLKQILTIGLVIGSGYGILFGLVVNSAVFGLGAGLVAGSMIALGVGTMTAWGRWVVLARIWLPLSGWLPRDLDAFLQDACERKVLRQVGTVYQFRHAQLRDHLCATTDTPPERILHRTGNDNGNLDRPFDTADTDSHG
ncbi:MULTISPECIES: XRE family transcriptional regulator [unclassified Streptomyces]|uniref:NACHT domain-containing protein n=1 Tax=unclassified Streptomyces TaxID=2593676 RepID=UPI00039D9727|nr:MULTISPECIES: XRE family transcriptional regulator [unclassified Streptomyces]MYT34349.1 XRE family transcriptional regulator [Streptomyces sp. SID8354]